MSRTEQHELIWLREEPGTRRPSHSRAQIAQAAVGIADREGFDAVSMRRVAQELGAGTMTLYHYVRNKDELLTLMHDEVMGEVLVPNDALPDDWREALTIIAGRSRAAFARHPWTLDRIGDMAIGPNGIRHFEQSLQAVRGMGMPVAARLHVLSLVDEYVMGFSMRENVDWTAEYEHGAPDYKDLAVRFFQYELDSGQYPEIEKLMSELDEPDAGKATLKVMQTIADPARFERGLDQLLDGVQASLARKPTRAKRTR
jgi:AcrR family transcriptional regulator